MKLSLLACTAITVATVAAQATQSAYGQCSGKTYTGPTICPTGWKCKCQNEWYGQCVNPANDDSGPGCAATSSSSSSTTQKPPTTTTTTNKPSTTTVTSTTTTDNNGPITITRSVTTVIVTLPYPTNW